MKIYPSKQISFSLINSQEETLARLTRRTEYSENLTSRLTNKSFIGIVKANTFQVISATIGFGAFCTLTGEINEYTGTVHVEIHKAFRILLGILFLLPVIGLVAQLFIAKIAFEPIMILAAALQIIILRFVIVELAFRFLSHLSLNRLQDVLDVTFKEGGKLQ